MDTAIVQNFDMKSYNGCGNYIVLNFLHDSHEISAQFLCISAISTLMNYDHNYTY